MLKGESQGPSDRSHHCMIDHLLVIERDKTISGNMCAFHFVAILGHELRLLNTEGKNLALRLWSLLIYESHTSVKQYPMVLHFYVF